MAACRKYRSRDSFHEKEVVRLDNELDGLHIANLSLCSEVQRNGRVSSRNEASIKRLTRELEECRAEVERRKNTPSDEVQIATLNVEKEIKLKEIKRHEAKEARRSEIEKHRITAETERIKAQNRVKEEFYKVEQAKYKAEEAKHVADTEKCQLMFHIAEGNIPAEDRSLLSLILSSKDRPELHNDGPFDDYDTLASETIPEGY